MTTRLGYAVLAHGDPRPPARLVGRLRLDGSPVVVHYDARSPAAGYSALQDAISPMGAELLVERVPCRWGGWSLVEASLRMVARLLQVDGCDNIVLLSGTHYPARPSHGLLSRLADDPAGLQLLDAAPVDADAPTKFRDRYETWHPVEGDGALALRLSGLSRIVQRAVGHRRTPPHGMDVHRGSQWWCLSTACLSEVLRDPRRPALEDFFRHSWIPDESYFQTLVCSTRWREQVIPPRLTYVRWLEPQPGPAVLELADLPAIQESQAHFVRKVDAGRSLPLLEALDRLSR